jgi:hypothetical protein
MEVTEEDLREQYESLETEELIEMYRNGELTELASSVLTQVLKERGISPENLPKRAVEEAKEPQTFQEDVSPSFLDLTHYIRQYESLETEELVEMIRKSELPEPAWSALTQVLEDRGISHEALSEPAFTEDAKEAKKSPKQESSMTRLLVPMNLRNILSETYRIYRRNFLRLIAIVGIVEGSIFLLEGFMTQGDTESTVLFILGDIVIPLCFIALMGGALVHAVSEHYLRQPISIVRAYRFAWKKLVNLVGVGILFGFAIVAIMVIFVGIGTAFSSGPGGKIGYIFGAVGFCIVVYLMIKWNFIFEAALLEGLGPKAALSRSSALVKGNWWRVWGIMFLLLIIGLVMTVILGRIPEVGTVLGSILSTPVLAVGNVLLYYDLRVRKERYTLRALAKELHIE